MAERFYARPAAALVPPHQGSQLPPPHLTQTLQHPRGDTMYQGYSKRDLRLTRRARRARLSGEGEAQNGNSGCNIRQAREQPDQRRSEMRAKLMLVVVMVALMGNLILLSSCSGSGGGVIQPPPPDG